MDESNNSKDGGREPRQVERHIVEKVSTSDKAESNVTFEKADGIIVLLDALGIKGIWSSRICQVGLRGYLSTMVT